MSSMTTSAAQALAMDRVHRQTHMQTAAINKVSLASWHLRWGLVESQHQANNMSSMTASAAQAQAMDRVLLVVLMMMSGLTKLTHQDNLTNLTCEVILLFLMYCRSLNHRPGRYNRKPV